MNVWLHSPTIINRRHFLRTAGLIALVIAFITTQLFAATSYAATSTTKTINFQGRLLKSGGAVVADGHYNVQFKIYEGGTGAAVGNPDGTLKWTETYANNGSNTGIQVKNGYFAANLGSVTSFGSSIDWDSDTIWLSMNVAGSSASCTSFNTAPCVADGEMLPMKRITATPYAINSGSVGGKSANELVQLGQGAQNDASNTSSIFINKTGSGNLIQLQSATTDVLTVTNSGDLTLGNNADKSISIAAGEADTEGRSLTIAAGSGGAGSGTNGGDLVLQGGNANGTTGDGGDIAIDAGAGAGAGSGGSISIGAINADAITIGSVTGSTEQTVNVGANDTAGSNTDVIVGSGGSAAGGDTTIRAKDTVTIETNGTARITLSGDSNTAYFGNGVSANQPNNYTIQGTNSSSSLTSGGSLTLQGGNSTTGDTNGGNVTLAGGSGSGGGASGLVILNTPTFSTVTNDANCYTGGAPVASSCTASASTINSASGMMIGFSATGQTATLPDPTIATAGRIMYVMAAGNSEKFTLSFNGGGAADQITMKPNATAALLWNGSDWTSASASTSKPIEYTDSGTRLQIGDGLDNGDPTLLTLDKSSSAPTITDEALRGSMYYDTTLGKVQCYEASGWGDCGDSPDTFVTISPEYTNAVMNGADVGTITSDLCSDTLNINDGSSSQPTICNSNETYNFYKWTSNETTDQTRSIYVTYQLPSNFKDFIGGSTSLMGRTDSPNASVEYQVYRDDSTGLTTCGSAVSVSTGAKSSWQKGTATTLSDPLNCSFEAGDSILVRINLATKDDANAYVSNLNFTFSSE